MTYRALHAPSFLVSSASPVTRCARRQLRYDAGHASLPLNFLHNVGSPGSVAWGPCRVKRARELPGDRAEVHKATRCLLFPSHPAFLATFVLVSDDPWSSSPSSVQCGRAPERVFVPFSPSHQTNLAIPWWWITRQWPIGERVPRSGRSLPQ